MILRLASCLPGYPMGVVEADQPTAIGSVKRQRVIQSMRLFSRYRNLRNHEPNPVTPIRIYDEHLPVKVEKHVEGGIVYRHRIKVIRLR